MKAKDVVLIKEMLLIDAVRKQKEVIAHQEQRLQNLENENKILRQIRR